MLGPQDTNYKTSLRIEMDPIPEGTLGVWKCQFSSNRPGNVMASHQTPNGFLPQTHDPHPATRETSGKPP